MGAQPQQGQPPQGAQALQGLQGPQGDQHLLALGYTPESVAQLKQMGFNAQTWLQWLAKWAPILLQLAQQFPQQGGGGAPGQPAQGQPAPAR